jgi:hypothetical protein
MESFNSAGSPAAEYKFGLILVSQCITAQIGSPGDERKNQPTILSTPKLIYRFTLAASRERETINPGNGRET